MDPYYPSLMDQDFPPMIGHQDSSASATQIIQDSSGSLEEQDPASAMQIIQYSSGSLEERDPASAMHIIQDSSGSLVEQDPASANELQDSSASSVPDSSDSVTQLPVEISSLSLVELTDSAPFGPIGPLLRQLYSSENSNQASVQELKVVLNSLYAILKDLDTAGEPGHTVRWWMKEVRDLCHEIKDYCDESVCSQIPWDFTSGFMPRVKAVSDRARSLRLTNAFNQDATAEPDAILHLPVPAAPMEDLVELLAFGDEKAKQLRVVTLFGFSGAVNTRGARSLYDLYGGRFQCRAFVRVSKDPDMRSLLTSILSQIKAPPDEDHGFSYDVSRLIRSVNNHLQHKRYFIVIDDAWTIPEWNTIVGAFPGGDCHSRVITTTQIKDVALASCDSYLQSIFEMTPLSDDQSGINQTPEMMKQELDHIYHKLSPELKTCLLYFNMYQAGYTIRKDDVVKQWIAECFLPGIDLGDKEMIAEQYFDKLVSTELIQPVERSCNDEVMSCTVEHMVLNMIGNKCKEVDFITTVSNMENGGPRDEARRLSVQFRGQVDAKIPENIVLAKVRSLAFSGFYGCVPSLVECSLLQLLILDIWADRGYGSFDLSGIYGLVGLRYLKIRCNITVCLPDEITRLESLETLEVDARIDKVPSDITSLERLLHLSLRSADLPTRVFYLSTLRTLGCFDLSRYSKQDVEYLFYLHDLQDLHLTCSAAHEANMQENMDAIWCGIFSPHRSLKSVDLVPAGSNHVNTAFFNIEDIGGDASTSASAPQSVLERLDLSPRICIFSSIPERFVQLGRLRILKIAVREISENDIDVLKRLYRLSALSLYVWTTFVEPPAESSTSNNENGPPRIEFGKDGYEFPHLSYFKFTCPSVCLAFLQGAMPSIRRLKLRCNGSTIWKYGLNCAGLEQLTSLEEISIKLGNDGAYESVGREVKSALESAFPNNSVRPIINIQSVDRIFGADQPEGADSSSVQSESSLHHQNQGEDDVVHRAKARGLLVYIIGHKNYKLIQREKEQMMIVIEGEKEDNRGPSTEKWILQLQELVYDIEDFIYNLSRLTKILSLADIVARMKHLKRRIKTLQNWQYAAQWSQLRGDSAVAATSGPVGYQTHPNCYPPESNLIGIDTPKLELLRLMEPTSSEDTQLMVISIVGCRGLGKSTLARAVYEHLRLEGKYQGPAAWVVASDCNSSGDLLNKIHQQLVPEEARGTTRGDYLLTHTLRERRYLLVIDQVQRAQVWHGMEDVFLQSNRGSRIIVTTSIRSVASAAAATTNSSNIYTMRSLGDEDSKSLFWKKFYGRHTEPAPLLANDSENIFKKCDGLPLSLLAMARYFRQHYRTGRIERFGRLVGGEPEALGEMNSALAQCYNSLRDNGHRLCLLSLSIFPRGHQINRKSVIRRWVAEGLVAGDGVRSGEEVAADRFDELVDRNIIEPVRTGNNSRVKRCWVHGPMLEFIVNKAISRNIVTLIHKDEAFPNKQDHLVRRLSVQYGTDQSERVANELGLSVIRSLTSFKRVLIDLHRCKLLRILDLEGCTGIGDPVLDAVCQLLILKYLSLRGGDVRRIPKRIKRLEYLETLDLRETEVEKLPIQVIMLPWLAHLFGKFDLPRELKDAKKNSKLHKFLLEKSRLQTLSGFIMDTNSGSESIILDARFLRKVKIWCKRYPAFPSQDILVSSINRRFSGSGALESMSIEIDTYGSPGFLHSLEAPCMLGSMKLNGQMGKLPDFITSSATTLRELQLTFTGLSSEELSLLQKLPCLLYLKLYEDRQGFGSGNFVVDSNGFPSLERMCFQAPTIPQLDIKYGAKTKLASLHLLCPEYPPSRIMGIQYLQHLSELVLHDSLEASEMEAWNVMAMKHENRPRVSKQAASS